MASSGWQQALQLRNEKFPTEWAPCHEVGSDTGRQVLPRIAEDLKAELVREVQKSLDRLVSPKPDLDSQDIDLLRARLLSLEEALRDCSDRDDETRGLRHFHAS